MCKSKRNLGITKPGGFKLFFLWILNHRNSSVESRYSSLVDKIKIMVRAPLRVEGYGNLALLLFPTSHPSVYSLKYPGVIGVWCGSHCSNPLIWQSRKLMKEQTYGRLQTRTQISPIHFQNGAAFIPFLILKMKYIHIENLADFVPSNSQ